MTHISVQNLSVYYDGHPGVKNIAVDIPRHKITAIIGPSGCGKSTLLKSFNRLLDEQERMKIKGDILVDGESIYQESVDVTQVRKKLGLLAQRPQVLPMSIFDNVAYGPRIHGRRNRKDLETLVAHHLKMAGLWDEVKGRLHTPASKLSIGQQQRLCLARGLAVEPEVILGDEPTSALDPISAETIERRFLELKKDYTIVFVTHTLRQARALADYVIFLYLGHLIEHGPAEAFFKNPRYEKTRAYLDGRFVGEYTVDKALDLKGVPAGDELVPKVCSTLEEMPVGKVLGIQVDNERIIDRIADVMVTAGDRLLETKRIGKQAWEMLVKKEAITTYQI